MQFGTLEVPSQLGGPGATGLVKFGDIAELITRAPRERSTIVEESVVSVVTVREVIM